jgi:hypothetical protein
VNIAKASLKVRLGKLFTRIYNRNEEMAKSLYYLKECGPDYLKKIDAVTTGAVNEAIAKALKGRLTFVAEGGEVTAIPSYDKLSQLFS